MDSDYGTSIRWTYTIITGCETVSASIRFRLYYPRLGYKEGCEEYEQLKGAPLGKDERRAP